MMRRTLANMASFYTEQQSVDVREGLARRVQEGWFVASAPYGYKNVRRNGRGIAVIDAKQAENVRRIFHLYAYESMTLDDVVRTMREEGHIFRKSTPHFPRSTVYKILKDRAYIGEVAYHGQWYPGKQEPIVDRSVWGRVQALLGDRIYESHELTYAGERITCGHCGHPITGEVKTKQTKSGPKQYVYYRCVYYNKGDHPRIRLNESKLDEQVLEIFSRMKIEDENVRDWFRMVLASQTRDAQAESLAQRHELQRQETLLVNQQDRLLNMRLDEEIDEAVYASKQTELRDRLAKIKLQIEALDRSHDESAELASRIFELSQTLTQTWVEADVFEKRKILEIVFLNFSLVDVSLVPTIRKAHPVLAY